LSTGSGSPTKVVFVDYIFGEGRFKGYFKKDEKYPGKDDKQAGRKNIVTDWLDI
jgi:hypothetical protein